MKWRVLKNYLVEESSEPGEFDSFVLKEGYAAEVVATYDEKWSFANYFQIYYDEDEGTSLIFQLDRLPEDPYSVAVPDVSTIGDIEIPIRIYKLEPEPKEFVLLEGLKFCNRFFTSNDPTEPESEKTRAATGEVVYRILGYADSVEEAQNILYGRTFPL